MTPFVRVEREAVLCMVNREAFLAKPLEFYRRFFNGRTPTPDEALYYIEGCVQRMTSMHLHENDLYFVQVFPKPPFFQLNIRRRDGEECKDWRHFQQIKNEILGPQYEAVELFPAEDRLIDTGNEYHLWAYADPQHRFPFGFDRRVVLPEQQRSVPQRAQHVGSMDSGVDEARSMQLAGSTG